MLELIILCWWWSWLIVVFTQVLIHEVVTLSFHTLPHALSIYFLVLARNFSWTNKKSNSLRWFIYCFVLPPILLLILNWMRRSTEKNILILSVWVISNRTFSNRCSQSKNRHYLSIISRLRSYRWDTWLPLWSHRRCLTCK